MDTKVPRTRKIDGELGAPRARSAMELGPPHPGARATCPSISSGASISTGCAPTGWRARAQALKNSQCGALLLFDVNNIRYVTAHQDRRMGARQALPLRAARRRRGADRLGFRLGRRASPALLRLAAPGELPRRHARHARHRAARGRADEEPCRGDHGPPAARPASRTCRSASTSPRRRCSSSCRRPG